MYVVNNDFRVRSAQRIVKGALLSSVFFAALAHAACDCGSTDEANSCVGNNISVTVGEHREVLFSWNFHSEQSAARCGQFANGDYWVAPAQGKSSVTISALSTSGSGAITLDENPQREVTGLLGGSRTYPNYSELENIADDLPLSFSASTSLVAAVQKNEAMHGRCGTRAIEGNCADAYHVVTVLSDVPPQNGANSLRPAITDLNKTLISLDDFDLSRLTTQAFFTGTDADGLEAIRTRWSHSTEIFGLGDTDGKFASEGGRAYRADLLIDDYAAGVSQQWHNDLFTLMSDDNNLASKTPAIAAMLTYGHDLFEAMYDEGNRMLNWGSGAGQHLGKFPPAVLFAALSRQPHYEDVLSATSTTLLGYSDTRGPHELEQINMGVHMALWGDTQDNFSNLEENGYWDNMLKSQCFDGASGNCNVNFGKKTTRDPYGYIDGPANLPGASYMGVAMGPKRAFLASLFLIPEMCRIVNYDSLLNYVDRVHAVGIQTANDECAPPDPRENPATCDAYRERNCQFYGRSNTGVATWGPDPANPGQCIRNADGQNGRFPGRHGTPLNYGYPSSQAEANWELIRGNESACQVVRVEWPTKVDTTHLKPIVIDFDDLIDLWQSPTE